jgi:hypothetical protein
MGFWWEWDWACEGEGRRRGRCRSRSHSEMYVLGDCLQTLLASCLYLYSCTYVLPVTQRRLIGWVVEENVIEPSGNNGNPARTAGHGNCQVRPPTFFESDIYIRNGLTLFDQSWSPAAC